MHWAQNGGQPLLGGILTAASISALAACPLSLTGYPPIRNSAPQKATRSSLLLALLLVAPLPLVLALLALRLLTHHAGGSAAEDQSGGEGPEPGQHGGGAQWGQSAAKAVQHAHERWGAGQATALHAKVRWHAGAHLLRSTPRSRRLQPLLPIAAVVRPRHLALHRLHVAAAAAGAARCPVAFGWCESDTVKLPAGLRAALVPCTGLTDLCQALGELSLGFIRHLQAHSKGASRVSGARRRRWRRRWQRS